MSMSPSSSLLMVRRGSGTLAPNRDEETRRSTLPMGPPAGQTSGGSAAKTQQGRNVARRIPEKRNTTTIVRALFGVLFERLHQGAEFRLVRCDRFRRTGEFDEHVPARTLDDSPQQPVPGFYGLGRSHRSAHPGVFASGVDRRDLQSVDRGGLDLRVGWFA